MVKRTLQGIIDDKSDEEIIAEHQKYYEEVETMVANHGAEVLRLLPIDVVDHAEWYLLYNEPVGEIANPTKPLNIAIVHEMNRRYATGDAPWRSWHEIIKNSYGGD